MNALLSLKPKKYNNELGRLVLAALVAMTAINILVVSTAFYASSIFTYTSDLAPHIIAGRIIKEGKGDLLYDINTQTYYDKILIDEGNFQRTKIDLLPYRYLPFVAAPYLLPIPNPTTVYRIFILINLLIFTLAALLLKGVSGRWSKRNVLIITACTPAAIAIIMGQLSILILAIFLTTIVLLERGKNLPAGLLAGTLLIKPQFLLALPILLLASKGRKGMAKFFLGASLTLVGLLAISTIISGGDFFIAYPKFLMVTAGPLYGTFTNHMFTLHAALDSALTLPKWKGVLIVVNVITYLLTISAIYVRHQKVGLSREKVYSLAVLCALVFSVHMYAFDLTLLLIPIFLLIAKPLSAVRTVLVLAMYTSVWLSYIELAWIVSLTLLVATVYLVFDNGVFPKRLENIED